MEIRKKSLAGEVYPPNTLYCLCCGIQRYLREEGQADINTFTDPKFKLFRDSLDAEMKRLTSLGVGVKQGNKLKRFLRMTNPSFGIKVYLVIITQKCCCIQ